MTIPQIAIGKSPADTKVVVAMSGGVDSSVVAAILVEAGYQVIGVTMQLYDHGAAIAKKNACCAGKDIYDARSVADRLGFPHYILDYEDLFRQEVIEQFASSYLKGETPIPCVRCNQGVKFRDLIKLAYDLNADALATGHYVHSDGARLYRGIDHGKDQSYFLFGTTREQLKFLRFPLGMLRKDETRELARKLGLSVAEKPDSQDICFVPDGDYAAVVKKMHPNIIRSGNIINRAGEVLGKHGGIINYTIGQRRGLGIAATEPLYVVELCADNAEVIVGMESELLTDKISLKDINLLGDLTSESRSFTCSIRLRSSQTESLSASIELSDTSAILRLTKPVRRTSAGQACVFYNKNEVLGGGWIV